MLHAPVTPPGALDDVRMLDTAKGVLVGLRHCSLPEAFADLVDTARRHDAGVLTLSRALVDLAQNPGGPHAGRAADVVRQTWGELLAQRD